jgi:polysaccharide export outer membrane protein
VLKKTRRIDDMKKFYSYRINKLHVLSVLLLCMIIFLTGCQNSPFPIKEPYTELEPILTERTVFAAGDDVEIRFTYAQQFSTSQTVRSDGKIMLPLLEEPEIMVQGKTPAEVREELMRLYSEPLKHPEIVVIARSLYHQRIYVGGEVKEPGTIDLPGQLTALEAIMQAGGFDLQKAEVKNVIVIRHKDGKRYGCSLDFRDALKGREATPFYLQPYDIVWVPRTNITKVNQWIDQYINKIVPQTGFLYRNTVGHHTIGIETDPYNVR